MNKFIPTLLILCTALLFNNCSTVDLNGLNPDNFQNVDQGGGDPSAINLFEDVNCGSVDSTFSTQVKPIFDTSCSTAGCHTGSNPAGGVQLDAENTFSTSTIADEILTGPGFNGINVHQSLILITPLASDAGGQPEGHLPGALFDSIDGDLEKIYCWLDGGLENDLDSDFNFGDDIISIFAVECVGCHNGGANEPDLRPETYTTTIDFYNVIVPGLATANSPAASPIYYMPTNSNPMDSHDGGQIFAEGSTNATIIENWINNGAPFD